MTNSLDSEQTQFQDLPTFSQTSWQMSYAERSTLEGLLSQLRPRLALEIGTAEGGSLRRIAAHSQVVHSFDLVSPHEEVAALENVTFHTGDSHKLLPQALEELAAQGRRADFVLVDGDHSAEGVRLDLQDLLASPVLEQTIILIHDTMNPEVRRGVEEVDLASQKNVAFVDLDFLPGYLARQEPYRLDLWGGLGLVVVDAQHRGLAASETRFHSLFATVRPMIDVMKDMEMGGTPLDQMDSQSLETNLHREVAKIRGELTRTKQALHALETSVSWRLTGPLREIKQRIKSQRGNNRKK